MTHIVMLHEGEMPTLEEAYREFQYLVREYGVILTKVNAKDFTDRIMRAADVILCVRGHSPLTYGILKEADRCGKKLYFLLDDDLKGLPKGAFWFPERKKWLLRCLSLCDGLMTSNPLIGDDYVRFLKSRNIVILHTAVNPGSLQKPRKEDGITRIVMAASEWHISDFETYVYPACVRLADEYMNKIEFYFVGLCPMVKELEKKSPVYVVPSMCMQEYVEYMLNHRFDIGIAVLIPNRFNARKYFNKFIEYTRYGICGVYSKCMPFELVVKNEINGIFTENTPEAWYCAIKKLIEEPKLRVQCINHAQEYLKAFHTEDYVFQKLVTDCPDLVEFESVNKMGLDEFKFAGWRIRQILFRVRESIYLTFSSLSHFGIKVTLHKINRKLRMVLE